MSSPGYSEVLERKQDRSCLGRRRGLGFALATVLAAGIAVRLLVLASYEPVMLGDSGSYLEAAAQWTGHDFTRYDGFRTPGYPFLIAACGGSPLRIWWAQSLLGLLVSLSLTWLVWARCGNAWAAIGAGAIHSLYLNQLAMEASIMTETLCSALVVACVLLYAFARPQPSLGWAFLFGFASAAAALTRPLFFFLNPLCALFAGLRLMGGGRPLRRAAVGVFVALLPYLVLGLLLSEFNRRTTGVFLPATVGGFAIMNHSAAFVEEAPDEYATLRDIFIRYRDRRLVETGNWNCAGFDALDEIAAATGWSRARVSQEMTRMSFRLLLRHPVAYAEKVAISWILFWRIPIYWHTDKLAPEWAAGLLNGAWRIQKAVGIAGSAFFLLLCFALARRCLRGGSCAAWGVELFIALTVLGTSIVPAMLEGSDLGRYMFPVQPLVIALVFIGACRWKLLWSPR